MTQPLEFKNFEAFVTVTDEGSFTRAAKKLRTNQPAISTRVAALEAQLGTRLIDRGARCSVLTPAGEILLPHARAILRETVNARLAIERFLGEPRGTLHIGASTVPGSYLLPGVLAKLREELPDVCIQLTVRDTRDTLEALRTDLLEVISRDVDGPAG